MKSLETLLTPAKLKKAHLVQLFYCEDVLLRFPLRYEDVKKSTPNTWQNGDKVWLEGQALNVVNLRIRSKLTRTTFLLQTSDALYSMTIFNRPWIKEGMHLSCLAKVESSNKLTVLSYNTRSLDSQLGLNPIYSNFKDLSANDFKTILDKCIFHLKDLDFVDVPDNFKELYKLVSYKQALFWMHRAKRLEELNTALRVLKYEEFLRFQTKLQFSRKENLGIDFGRIKVFDRRLIEKWKKQLPFQLTTSQDNVLNDILNDLQSSKRMYRLLQGDVGSGKTVVAALAMYASILAKFQTAFLVPTEILAYQHEISLKQYLPTDVCIEVLSSSKSSKERRDILSRLAKGEIDCLIGTHALIQDDVCFNNVGLVIADEQHRFGVNQRRKLSEKGEQVDFLLMSATPIPRTLAAVLFNDLDVSTISTYHASKRKVYTKIIHENSLKPILKEVIDKISSGQQVYVVCPAIVDNVETDTKSVELISSTLIKALPKKIRIASLHSKLKSDEKDKIMQKFSQGLIDILVSTTVIEVGVNVHNANCMIIYNADHFGLSQLHQLRGRVGRGQDEGYCYLLSDSEDELSLKRLKVLEESTDGFYIANKDLELRGPGELFGLKQAGVPSFLVANVILDQKILLTAQKDAEIIMKDVQNPLYKAWIERCKQQVLTESLD